MKLDLHLELHPTGDWSGVCDTRAKQIQNAQTNRPRRCFGVPWCFFPQLHLLSLSLHSTASRGRGKMIYGRFFTVSQGQPHLEGTLEVGGEGREIPPVGGAWGSQWVILLVRKEGRPVMQIDMS